LESQSKSETPLLFFFDSSFAFYLYMALSWTLTLLHCSSNVADTPVKFTFEPGLEPGNVVFATILSTLGRSYCFLT